MGSGKAMTKGTPHSADYLTRNAGEDNISDILRISNEIDLKNVPVSIQQTLARTNTRTKEDFENGLINTATISQRIGNFPYEVRYANTTPQGSLGYKNLTNLGAVERVFNRDLYPHTELSDLKLVSDTLDAITIADHMTKHLNFTKIPMTVEFNASSNARANERPSIPLASFAYYPGEELPPVLQLFTDQKSIQTINSKRGIDYNATYEGDNYKFTNMVSRSSFKSQFTATQNVKQSIFHEYGHLVYHSLNGRLGRFNIPLTPKMRNAMEVFESNTAYSDAISQYGNTSRDEAFAEAFANYMKGSLYVPFPYRGNAYYREFLVLMNTLKISPPALIQNAVKNTSGGTSPYRDSNAIHLSKSFASGANEVQISVPIAKMGREHTLTITKADYQRTYKYVLVFGQYRKYNTRTGRLISVSTTEPKDYRLP